MAAADLQRNGVPLDEQICLCDAPSVNSSASAAQRGAGSRYAPGDLIGAQSIDPSVVNAPSGKNMARFSVNEDQDEATYFTYQLHTQQSRFDIEFEFEIVASDTPASGYLVPFELIDENGDSILLRFIPSQSGDDHAGWRVEKHNGSSATHTLVFLDAGPGVGGGTHSVRLKYTASDNPGTATSINGTLEMWIGANTESIVDTEVLGDSFAGWTKVIDLSGAGGSAATNVANGLIDRVRIGWQVIGGTAANRALISDITNSGVYFRYMAIYNSDALPTTDTSTTNAWCTLHHYTIEKMDCEWNSGADGWDINIGVIYPYHWFKPSTTSDITARYWTSYANYLADATPAGTSSTVSISNDSNGYFRGLLTLTGVPADTAIWLDTEVNVDSTTYTSLDSEGEVHGCVRTFAKSGTAHTTGFPMISVLSCSNEQRWGPNQFTHHGKDIVRTALGAARGYYWLHVGDWGYMDEREYVKSGGDFKGAESQAAMKSVGHQLTHSYSYLRAVNTVFMRCVGDDHDRSINDSSLLHLLEEDGTKWDRSRTGVTTNDEAWTNNNWEPRGISSSNSDVHGAAGAGYGFPCVVRPDPTKAGGDFGYEITPRSLGSALLTYNRDTFSDTLPSSAGVYRYDPSGVDKYGSNQGGSGDKLDADDSQFTYIDIGKVRILTLDTRLFTDRSNLSAGTLLGAAKTWVLDKISTSTQEGLIIAIPGYVQGVGDSATLKQNDNYATGDEVSFSAEKTEVFDTTLQANSNIKWAGILCGDHHFLTIDRSVQALNDKYRWQIGSGGVQGIRQEPDNIDDTGYLLITDAGAETSSHTVRTEVYVDIQNESLGKSSITAYRMTDAGKDLLGTFALPGVTPHATKGAWGISATSRDIPKFIPQHQHNLMILTRRGWEQRLLGNDRPGMTEVIVAGNFGREAASNQDPVIVESSFPLSRTLAGISGATIDPYYIEINDRDKIMSGQVVTVGASTGIPSGLVVVSASSADFPIDVFRIQGIPLVAGTGSLSITFTDSNGGTVDASIGYNISAT